MIPTAKGSSSEPRKLRLDSPPLTEPTAASAWCRPGLRTRSRTGPSVMGKLTAFAPVAQLFSRKTDLTERRHTMTTGQVGTTVSGEGRDGGADKFQGHDIRPVDRLPHVEHLPTLEAKIAALAKVGVGTTEFAGQVCYSQTQFDQALRQDALDQLKAGGWKGVVSVPGEGDLLSNDETAKRLGISVRTLQRRVKEGKLSPIKDGNSHPKFKPADVDLYVTNCRRLGVRL